MGNAHFREGHLGQAIRYYEKTLETAPFDRHAVHSLRIAQKRIAEPIAEMPIPIWTSSWRLLVHYLGASGLLLMGLLLYLVVMGLLAHWIWYKNTIPWRRRTLMVLVPIALVFLGAGYLASVQYGKRSAAVVVSDRTNLRASADEAAKVVRVVTEGIVVDVVQSKTAWTQARLPNGDIGWLKSGSVAKI